MALSISIFMTSTSQSPAWRYSRSKTRGNGARSRLSLRFNWQSQDGPPSYYYLITGSELPVSFFNLSVATMTQSFLPVISAQIVVFPSESK